MDPRIVSDLLTFGTKVAGLDKPTQAAGVPAPVKKYHSDNAVPGLSLYNYTDRKPSEDGKYVVVTTHTERVELIIQEPTELEKKEKRESDQFRLLVVCGSAVFIAGTYFTYKYLEAKRHA